MSRNGADEVRVVAGKADAYRRQCERFVISGLLGLAVAFLGAWVVGLLIGGTSSSGSEVAPNVRDTVENVLVVTQLIVLSLGSLMVAIGIVFGVLYLVMSAKARRLKAEAS